ncbi:glycine cleavage system protein GcvH [Enterococcus sp. BWB1-3]|uniref:glycine cleavage system protein GcvH n=1 Tax=unclassified Enterococcus TaxID=2608891 RepID=UPI001920FDD3|nr:MULTISPECIES: glycine cleavage system protein GcvH [unclassified Enterococcus]MBL1230445.1 glycine cleavage system protein GcvH [Enterococcus sp. BWB1-3]MCB5950820.1 glycine cleavage system protein GcvH [Enterococcus sp. BWT-B8]
MSEVKFTKSHEWVKLEGDTAKVGISDYAQEELGDIVYIDLPDIDDEVSTGEGFADIESVKTASELYSPISGTVSAVNEELEDSPELINSAPYDSWIMEVKDLGETAELMTKEEYEVFVQKESEK